MLTNVLVLTSLILDVGVDIQCDRFMDHSMLTGFHHQSVVRNQAFANSTPVNQKSVSSDLRLLIL